MGSAEGRRKCCENFWYRGYAAGYDAQCRGTAPFGRDDIADQRQLYFFAHTVSKSLAGLFRAGCEVGGRDRQKGQPRGTTTYEMYRAEKDKVAPTEPLTFEVDHIYRAKKPREIMAFGEYNDRQILHIGPMTVQYDSSALARGKKYPSIPKEQFEAWAGKDVTEEYKTSCHDGEWAKWPRKR